MTHVYVVYHLYTPKGGDQQVLVCGTYGSRPTAVRAIARMRKLPGFKKRPKLVDQRRSHGDGFIINRVELGHENWPHGFST